MIIPKTTDIDFQYKTGFLITYIDKFRYVAVFSVKLVINHTILTKKLSTNVIISYVCKPDLGVILPWMVNWFSIYG